MRASVQAAVAYKRKVLIDAVTSDEDKVAPVYRLEEICQVLKNSPPDVVREMLERILERLNHRNPIVKQKTLRLIKYAAGKGGTDFRREIQRQAGAVKALFNYKGQLDALKGDALNKAVRDTAHEAVAAIFGTEEKTTTLEEVGRRIQGFGSSNYESRPKADDKKSVLSDLVGYGSQSLKQSIEIFQNYNQYPGSGSGGNRSSLSGSYRAQGLRRSLTAEPDKPSEKEEGLAWSVRDAEVGDGRTNSFRADSSVSSDGTNSKVSGSNVRQHATAEDRLLESLTVPGGVRLQPSREALQTFTSSAQKLDASGLVHSLDAKLQAHSWQVRFKTLCLIEALLRARAENVVLDTVAAMFEEDARLIVDSLQSPQTSLRDKAKKVLDMLGGSQQAIKLEGGAASHDPRIANSAVPDLPDLLDTRDIEINHAEDFLDTSPSLLADRKSDHMMLASSATSTSVDDLLGNWSSEAAQDTELDPFAGMSLHSVDGEGGKGKGAHLPTSGEGINRVIDENGTLRESTGTNSSKSFNEFSTAPKDHASVSGHGLLDLMGGLTTSQGSSSGINIVNSNNLNLHMNTSNVNAQLQSLSTAIPSKQQPNPLEAPIFNGELLAARFQPPPYQGVSLLPGAFPNASVGSQMFPDNTGRAQNYPGMGAGGPFSANVMHQSLAGRHVNFTNAHPAFGQSQLGPSVSSMSNSTGPFQTSVLNSSLKDDFDFSSDPKYTPTADVKENTKAFDFISDHMSSPWSPKTSK